MKVERRKNLGGKRHTNFDIASSVEKDIVGLDVTMNDVLAVEMRESFACLAECQ